MRRPFRSRWIDLAQLTSASVGLLIAGYLAAVRLGGNLPACGPLEGCETVALSAQSAIAGIPVAVLGVGFSGALVILAIKELSTYDRRRELLAYGLGLLGVIFVGYLTVLELFVIHALCVWCVAYAITVAMGFGAAAFRLWPRHVARPPRRT